MVDIKTKHWAKDILYFWDSDSSTRTYIIPSSHDSNPTPSPFDSSLIQKRNYIHPNELSSIHLQGTQISFPALYQEKGISTKDLYNFLKLGKPSKVTITDEQKIFETLELFPEGFKECENETKIVKYSENQIMMFVLVWYIYLSQKHKDCLFPLSYYEPLYKVHVPKAFVVSVDVPNKEFKGISLDYKDEYREQVEKGLESPKIKFIVILFGIDYQFDQPHLNVIILDKTLSQMIIFDPWGKTKYYSHMNSKVYPLLLLTIAPDFKIVNTIEYSPIASFQVLEYDKGKKKDLGGFCCIWCLTIIGLRLRYRNKTMEELMVDAIQTISKKYYDFRFFIRQYSNCVGDFAKEIEKGLTDPVFGGHGDRLSEKQRSIIRCVIDKYYKENMNRLDSLNLE
jgi:hypothetical protein